MTTQTIHPVQTLFRPGSLAHQFAWRVQRRAALKILLVLLTLSLIGCFYLSVARTAADLNREIVNCQNEIETLERANAEMRVQIARQQSLDMVEERAAQLGLSPSDPAMAVYLPANGLPVAEASNLPASQ